MTRLPSCAARFAATRPAMPAPITITSCWTSVLAITPAVRINLPDAAYLVCPDLEAQQRVRAERIADCDVSRIAASRNEHPADPRHIVPRIKDVPAAAEIRLDPSGEIHWPIRRQDADLAEITSAVARRNVHAAAKCDGEVRIIAADAFPLVEGFKGRLGGTRVLVAERDMVVNKIADRLNPCPARRRIPNRFQAIWDSRSVSQYRLPRRNIRVSSG